MNCPPNASTNLNKQAYFKKGTYALSINPSDKYQFFGKPKRLIHFQNFMVDKLIHYSQINISIKLFYELSEPLKVTPNKSPNGQRS